MNNLFSSARAKWILAAIALVIVLLAGAGWLGYEVYYQRSGAPLVRALGSWLPAARFGSKTVTYGEYLTTRDELAFYLASPYGQSQTGGESLTPELEQQAVMQRLLRDDAVDEIAQKRGVTVSDDDVNQAYSVMLQSSSSTVGDVATFLKTNFNWTEADFRANVIQPSLLEERVANTFASDTTEQVTELQDYLTTRLKQPDVRVYLHY